MNAAIYSFWFLNYELIGHSVESYRQIEPDSCSYQACRPLRFHFLHNFDYG
ncbi:hypothetical protein PRUB_b0671 [Pseudoalteromonas rubra]|uniref:Uncharacterized protein n=1 Tax=Pseudoalteromonas rubra TaxID=43658 RepID=A0A8T0C0E4_9GAMM|nr:hypothetical protein PRUB_b0671 [Pseudoalteromonas rubra]